MGLLLTPQSGLQDPQVIPPVAPQQTPGNGFQFVPQGMQGFGSALSEAYPLLLAMANGLREGDGVFSNAPQGLAAMAQMQEKREDQEAREADNSLLMQMLGGVPGNVSTQGGGMSRNQAMAANGGPTNAAANAMNAPANWADIRNGIFAGESGGDYDALFGYSNRPGQPFSNVKLTDMTVDEAIAFSDPSGPYGQWVKGQVGRVATPMGAYQIVGTTLRGVKDQMGLTGNERMTPELQEAMGQHIYRTQGTGAWEGYKGPQSGGATPTQGGGIDPARLAQVLNSPTISPAAKQLVLDRYQQQNQPQEAGYRILTQQEAQAFNLPQGQTYQVGPDGKISIIGGGGVTTNVNLPEQTPQPQVGSIPQGFALIEDESEQSGFRMVPISGGPEDTAKQDAARRGAQETSGDVVLSAAIRARDASTDRVFGGLAGQVAAINPSSKNAEVYRQVQVLKDNATIESLNAMRMQSPTGGALGNVTEGEGKMLAARAGALDPASPNFERDLADYTSVLLQTIHGRKKGLELFAQQWGDQQKKPITQAASMQTNANPYAGMSDQEFNSLDLTKLTTEQIDQLFEARNGQ